MFSVQKANNKRKRKINLSNRKQCALDCDYLSNGVFEHQYVFRCLLPSIQKGELQKPKGVFLKHFAKYPERCQYCLDQKTILKKIKK